MSTNQRIRDMFGTDPVVWVAAWGISRLRKRGGQLAGAINGASLIYDQWYDRVISEESARILADLGVNLVILPFSLGGDEKIEKEERDDFERMTGYLHGHGIRSVPYFQYQNILQEAFTFENTTWGVKLDGSPKQYTYWRRTACQSSPEFIDYMKGLIEDAIGRGADGIWIDNTHHIPCACHICIGRFKAWLNEHRRHLLDELFLETFDNVAMPPAPGGVDPIGQALLEFNCELNLSVIETLRKHLSVLKPAALFGSNPGIYRGNRSYNYGIDLLPFIRLHELMYLENRFYPEKNNAQTSGNFHGFISCEAAGSLGIPGAWKHHRFDDTLSNQKTGLPETAREVRRIIFEAAATGGALGMNWAVRSLPEYMCNSVEDLKIMYIEHPVIMAGSRSALEFTRSLPGLGDWLNGANVAVLRHRSSLSLDSEVAWASAHCIEEILHTSGVPYSVLYSEDFDEKAAGYKLIVLPGVSILADEDTAKLSRYVADGGRLLSLGNCGLYDERLRERPEFALGDVLQVSRFKRDQKFVKASYGKGRTIAMTRKELSSVKLVNLMIGENTLNAPIWFGRREEIVTAIDWLLGDERQIRMPAGCDLAVTLRKNKAGAVMLHFLNYAAETRDSTVRVSVNEKLNPSGSALWHTPGGSALEVKPETVSQGWLHYRLENFDDYGVLQCD